MSGPPDRTGGARAPDAEHPYWRRGDGTRVSFTEVTQGLPRQAHEHYAPQHAPAVAALALAGVKARLDGNPAEGRRLMAIASRLCTEPLGHWPPSASTT